MMSLINQYIKNIIKTRLQILFILIPVALTGNQYTDNSITQKQKSLNDIDEEILQLEQDLDLNIDLQENTKEQIKKITSNLEKERKKLLRDRAQKETQEKLLQK